MEGKEGKTLEEIKNIRVYLNDADSEGSTTQLEGDATFDPTKEVITLDNARRLKQRDEYDDNNEDQEVVFQVPYKHVLYWALLKEYDPSEDDTEKDEEVTQEEVKKTGLVNFFNKMFKGE